MNQDATMRAKLQCETRAVTVNVGANHALVN
jgi:hypothetical protein